jgi:D-serine deaminase-like pyridoxal phosphate-dependent protein
VLVENAAQAQAWAGSRLGIFIDVNPGMDRTGIQQDREAALLDVARAVTNAGLALRGLHYYDGHVSAADLAEREAMAHRGYARLMEIVARSNAPDSRWKK